MTRACAQAFAFFLAGFETSSTSIYCLHELAFNLEVQEKLRKEMKDTLGDRDDFTYEDVFAMPYLDKVVSSTIFNYIYYSTIIIIVILIILHNFV